MRLFAPFARDRSPGALRLNPQSLVRQLRPIALFKAIQLLGMALFTVVAPRLMGPELFGRFAVILSLTALWMTTSNFGARYVFGRYLPEYAANGSDEKVRGLFMHLLEFRLVVVAVAAVPFWLLLRKVLPAASATTLTLSVATFAAMTLASPMYTVFYGLNRLSVSMGREAFGRYALLLFVVLLGGTASLERAATALLVTQALALAVGIVLCRDLFTLQRSAHDWSTLAGYLRFGFAIFAANILLRLPWRLGESALALARVDSAEIAFFNISLSAAVAYTRILGSTVTLQLPSLSLQQASGNTAGRDRSLGQALKFLSAAGVLFALGIYALGPWVVRSLLGEEFLGVIPNLMIVVTAALPVPYVRTALSLAVVESRVSRGLQLGLVAIAVFGGAAWWLVPRYASRGATLAVVAAIFAAGVVACLQMRGSGVLGAAESARHLLAAAAPAALLAVVGITPGSAVGGALGYVLLLFALGVVEWQELVELYEESRGGGDRDVRP